MSCEHVVWHTTFMPMLNFATTLSHRPRRVLVAGNSGAGKTTLAARIAQEMGDPTQHIEIDALYHGPNWQPRSTFIEDVDAFSHGETWVTEWSYTSVLGRRLTDRADLFVWLGLPRWQVTYQVVKRTLQRRIFRQELWNGNIEPPLRTFFTDPEHVARYAIWHYSTKRHKFLRMADRVQDLTIVRLTSHRQADRWLSTVFRDAIDPTG